MGKNTGRRKISREKNFTGQLDHNVYASFRPSIATKDAEMRSKMNTALCIQSVC